jgi:hypothetical protein
MKVRNIHPAMKKCSRVEEKALESAGLNKRDFDHLTKNLVWHNPDFPIGPSSKNFSELEDYK